jgi:hypothetical protein
MATSIDRFAPRIPKCKSPGAIPVFDEPGDITPLLRVANEIKSKFPPYEVLPLHLNGEVHKARIERDKRLPLFAAAEQTRLCFGQILGWYGNEPMQVERSQAADILGALAGAFGQRAEHDIVSAMVDMLANGDVVNLLSDLWEEKPTKPLRAAPITLALACRRLISRATYPPRPSEIENACRDVNYGFGVAGRICESLVNVVRAYDAVLLEFDRDEWERPYLTPQYRPVLRHMLELHAKHGLHDMRTPDDGRELTTDEARRRDLPDAAFQAALAVEMAKVTGVGQARLADLRATALQVRLAVDETREAECQRQRANDFERQKREFAEARECRERKEREQLLREAEAEREHGEWRAGEIAKYGSEEAWMRALDEETEREVAALKGAQ